MKKDEVCYLSSGRLRYPATSPLFIMPDPDFSSFRFFSCFQHDSGNFHAIVALLDFLPGRPAKELCEAVCAVFASLLAALPMSRKRKRLERRLRDVSASSPCSPENFPARINWEHEDRSFGNFGMGVRL